MFLGLTDAPVIKPTPRTTPRMHGFLRQEQNIGQTDAQADADRGDSLRDSMARGSRAHRGLDAPAADCPRGGDPGVLGLRETPSQSF